MNYTAASSGVSIRRSMAMIFKWIPLKNVGPFIFGSPIDEYIDKFVKNLPEHILSWSLLFFKYSLQGEKEKAIQMLTEERKNYAAKDYHFPWLMAECFALLDEKKEALDWLELAVEKGWINYPLFSKLDPFLKNIRGEARFKKLMEKVKYEWQHVEELELPKE